MVIFVSIAVAMVAGLLMTRVTNLFHLPDVTAYLIAGLLIGPFFLGRLGVPGLGFNTYEQIDNLNLLSNLALGFIAFAIGNEFMISKLRHTGRQAVVIVVFEALGAVVLVTIILSIVHFLMPDKLSLHAAITLGAIASATAPAATLMVVRQYKAKGAVTELLLPIVALDDAVGLICFAVAIGIAKALISGTIDVISIIVNPVLEIVLSLALGAFLGFVLTQIERIYHSNRNRMILIISFVIFTVALSMMEFDIGPVKISFSSLLVCMMLGTVFCNACPLSEDLMERADRWTAPLYCLFFVLSGAELKLDVFSDLTIAGIGLVYVVSRASGKYIGASLGSRITHCPPQVVKYLGITLFPQAGVALGMSLSVAEQLGSEGVIIRNIVLLGVLIYELFGPTLTKIALTKSGDIVPPDEQTKNRRKTMLENAQKNGK